MSPKPLKTDFISFSAFQWVCWALIAFGVLLRLMHIAQNDFVFYDEGMYLSHNRELLDKIAQFPPKDLAELFAIIKILFTTALMTAKWLWFFVSNLRVFVGGPDMFYFTREVSAVCGIATVFLTYAFARRYFKSHQIGLLAAAMLAVLPSHVFYSRLAMQEGLSALCFLGGMYLYFSSREFGWRTILASVLFSAVFFTNYRMIILPILLVAAELTAGLFQKDKIRWIKLCGAVLMFLGIVFWIGSLNNGSNRSITVAWMTHQAGEAPQKWHWINIFSYPYDLFALEGLFFGAAFFLNIYWVYRRQWDKLLPFALVIVQMAIFTVASEKGARYLCVVLPFAAMAAAVAVHQLVLKNDVLRRFRWTTMALCAVMFLTLGFKSLAIAESNSGYENVVRIIKGKDPEGKILTTQPLVVGLFTSPDDVKPAPKSVRDLVIQYARGYRYLVIDPQAYVSWTADGARFTPLLTDYLGLIRNHLPPIFTARHLNRVTLERFVLDHNENLANSIRFLADSTQDYGSIYVYDLSACLETMQKIMQSQNE